jgi:hypothetical protein
MVEKIEDSRETTTRINAGKFCALRLIKIWNCRVCYNFEVCQGLGFLCAIDYYDISEVSEHKVYKPYTFEKVTPYPLEKVTAYSLEGHNVILGYLAEVLSERKTRRKRNEDRRYYEEGKR